MSQVFTIPDDVIDRNPPEPPPLDEREAVRRYGRLLQASAGAARALEGLEGRFANETDWVTAPDRFRADADTIGRDFADSLGNDRTGLALFLRDFASLADARGAAFASASEAREREALQAAYADRMTGLARIASRADGSLRDEALRQAALEAHRAHAFGFENDPAATVERFVAEIRQDSGLRFDGQVPQTPEFDRTDPALERANQDANRFGMNVDRTIDWDAYEQALNIRRADDAPVLGEVVRDLNEAKAVLATVPDDADAHRKYDQAVAQLESRLHAIELALAMIAPFALPAGAGALGMLGSIAARQTISGIIRSEIEAMKVIPKEQRNAPALQEPERAWEMGESP